MRAAQYRGVTTYQDIAAIMGLPQSGAFMGREVGQVLGEISEDEYEAGRPLLSVVAVSKQGVVGPGLFWLAKKTGQREKAEDKIAYIERERQAVYSAWRRPLPKK